eukprot:EG_transcript_3488
MPSSVGASCSPDWGQYPGLALIPLNPSTWMVSHRTAPPDEIVRNQDHLISCRFLTTPMRFAGNQTAFFHYIYCPKAMVALKQQSSSKDHNSVARRFSSFSQRCVYFTLWITQQETLEPHSTDRA